MGRSNIPSNWTSSAILLGARTTVLVVIGITALSPVTAEEIRVYTRVSSVDSQPRGGQPPEVFRSLTLFHAGKVYDYIDHSQEITIFEPAHHRFTLVDEARRQVTEITQDEVRRYLSLAEDEAAKLIQDFQRTDSPASRRAAACLEFQISPVFETNFNQQTRRLTLQSDFVHYDVMTDDGSSAEARERYLAFADATAQLNSVLHPQSLLPKSRLALNGSLRARELLPTSVTLTVNSTRQQTLKAEHEIGWKLTRIDREFINHWENLLRQLGSSRVPFRQYQQQQLSTELPRKR
jgi:hypothetical protein